MSQSKTTNPSSQEMLVVHRRELSKPSEQTGHQWWVVSFVGLAILTILHLPIFLMRQEEKPAVVEESHGQLFAIINEENASISPAESSLWQYLHFTDPSQWFYPSPTGFSRYNRRTPLPKPRLPGYIQSQNPLPEHQFSPTPLVAEISPMKGQEFLTLLPYIPEPTAPGPQEPPLLPPRWRRIGGRVLENPPEFPKEVLDSLKDPEIQSALAAKCKPTVLEVNVRPGLSLPRILIRETCGVHALDSAAQKAVRDALFRKFNDSPCETPQSFFLVLDWLM